MIDPTELTESDKGRQVIYEVPEGTARRVEFGVISSWNDKYIFVRYTHGDTAAATNPEDLDFAFALEPSKGETNVH